MTLKTFLNNMITEDADDAVGEPGRVAYKPDERTIQLRARRREVQELERELGRKLDQEELDLIFGDLDVTDPATPRRITMDGDYGRGEAEEDGFETRRAERGPTNRRFN